MGCGTSHVGDPKVLNVVPPLSKDDATQQEDGETAEGMLKGEEVPTCLEDEGNREQKDFKQRTLDPETSNQQISKTAELQPSIKDKEITRLPSGEYVEEVRAGREDEGNRKQKDSKQQTPNPETRSQEISTTTELQSPTLDEQIKKLMTKVFLSEDEGIKWSDLRKQMPALSDGLLELGIARSVEDFLDECLARTSSSVPQEEFLNLLQLNGRVTHSEAKKMYNKHFGGALEIGWDLLIKNKSSVSEWLHSLQIESTPKFNDLFAGSIPVPKAAMLDIVRDALKSEWYISQALAWLTQTDILRCIVTSEKFPMSKDESDPLKGLRALRESVRDIEKMTQDMVKDIKDCLVKNIAALPKAVTARDVRAENNSKFVGVFEAKYGGLLDFEKGIRELVGAPHPNVWEEMNAEHMNKKDSETKFKPGNYETEPTTSREEFSILIDPTKGKKVTMGNRKIKSLEMLRREEMAIRAKLWKEELIALSLYTGPMFYKYNAVLRWKPDDEALKTCLVKAECDCKNKESRVGCTCYNRYPTTINAIVSGLRKLMWAAPIPKERFVYRGLNSQTLPHKFFDQDEYGVRGGTEFGMMSTTTDIHVAIQYSVGTEKNAKLPTVFKISIDAINRGASVEFCSQYPGEKEILFTPLSFLEVVGEISYTKIDGVDVRVVPLQIIANLNSPGLEDLIGMRKKLHIDSFEHQQENLRRELFEHVRAYKGDFEAFPKEKQKKIIDKVEFQFREVLEKHKRRPAKWYNDDGRYRSAVIEMLNMKENAMAVPKLSKSMFDEWESKQTFLRQANRMESKEVSRALRNVRTERDKSKLAAFELCKKNGIVAEDLEERNEMSETPLIREAAEGDARAVLWLLEAGADVDARMDNEMGFTAINQAAYFGNASCIVNLLQYKANPCVLDRSGGTPLVAAALNGELDCIRALLNVAGDKVFNETKLWPECEKICTELDELKGTTNTEENKGQIDKSLDAATLEQITILRKRRDKILLNCLVNETKEESTDEIADGKDVKDCQNINAQGDKVASLGIVEAFMAEEAGNEKAKDLQNRVQRNASDSTEAFVQNQTVKYINKATFPNRSTPLMKAASNGHVSCVRFLILAGADKGLKNKKDQTAFDVVREVESNYRKDNKNSLDVDLLERFKQCERALNMSPEDIRMEDSVEVMCFDASRREAHLQTFENQALNLKQELERLIENSKDCWCDHKDTTTSQKADVISNVVREFKALLNTHKTRNAKWYNDGGKYRSAVSEMLSMKDNAIAVAKLSKAAFDEWQDRLEFLRQANRMVTRENLRSLRDMAEESEERRTAAFEICKRCGIIMDVLEERNEMSETPLIREAGADANARQTSKMGFTAMVQAAYFGHAPCVRTLLEFNVSVNDTDGFGGTPLVAAALNGEDECVSLLIDARAKVNQATKSGSSPLMKAAKNGHSKCVRLLILALADISASNPKLLSERKPATALKMAEEGRKSIVLQLSQLQEEYYDPQKHSVTYEHLKTEGFDSYMWDHAIGKHGGFWYYSNESGSAGAPQPIDFKDIKEVELCGTDTSYWPVHDVSGLSKTTVEVKGSNKLVIPVGTLYGWDHDAGCWTYFTDCSSKPTHFAGYTKNGVTRGTAEKTLLVKRSTQKLSQSEKSSREKKRSSLMRLIHNYEDCVRALNQEVSYTQKEDWEKYKEHDSTRKDSHMKTFEMQSLVLKRELMQIMKTSASEFCCNVTEEDEQQEMLDLVVRQFNSIKQKHQERSSKWYNDDGRYRSGVIEMLSMKENAMAIPKLTMTMYKEWKSKLSFLRQADRMISRERIRAMREAPVWSDHDDRKVIALKACKAVGAVMEHLEERNEMSETPLIREAADGNARNVLLLLEAGADVDAQQSNNIGFTALTQAAYFGHPQCAELLLQFGAEVDSTDCYGGTPLVAAALNGEIECVRVLLDARADVNHATTNLNTPIMKAALNGHVGCVRLLLGMCADAAKSNKDGHDALKLSRQEREKAVSQLRMAKEDLKNMEESSGAQQESSSGNNAPEGSSGTKVPEHSSGRGGTNVTSATNDPVPSDSGTSDPQETASRRSIQKKRYVKTIERLEKLINSHDDVQKDLGAGTPQLMQTQYPELFAGLEMVNRTPNGHGR